MEMNFRVIVLVLFTVVANAQQSDIDFEEKALSFFCDSIVKNDKEIKKMRIYFKGYLSDKPSSIFNIANSLGDIHLLKDSIPNRVYLDSLENSNKKKNIC